MPVFIWTQSKNFIFFLNRGVQNCTQYLTTPKFKEGKFRVLHSGSNNPMHQYRLGKASVENLLERSSAEKDLVVLGENKLPMSQQCALVAKKAKRIPGWIRKSIASHSKEVILLFYSALVRPYLCPILGSSVAERDGVPRIGPVNGNKDDQHIEKLSYKERVRELGPFSLEKDV